MTGTRWLDERQERAWRAFLRMQSRLSSELNRQLQAGSGLSLADYDVLVHLTDAPGARLRPYELQQRLDWEQSRLSHHLNRMQRRGLVARTDCADDRRGSYIVLTAAGREAITAAAPGHVDAVRALFVDALDPEQLAVVEDVATRVLGRIAAEPAER